MNINKNPKTSPNSQRISETPISRFRYSTRISESKYLPPEICTQILTKLPAKSLLRFRCVCRSWCSIIDDPDFVDMHFKLCNNNSGKNNSKLLIALEDLGDDYYEGCMLTVREADTLQKTCRIFMTSDAYSYHIIGSCNGLLLVNQKNGLSCYPEELRLWNPSIRKSLILPANPHSRYLISYTTRYLFGFAPDSKDYKVAAFKFGKSRGIEPGKMYFAVFTLRDQQWTVRNNQFDITLMNPFRDGYGPFQSLSTAVFFHGAAYWLGQNDNRGRRGELTHLCSFDFESENITFLELPFTLNERSNLGFLFLFGESLAIFSISKVASSIWVLQQDNAKRRWTLWFSGKSSPEAFAVLDFCYFKHQKLFYCESGGYFVCGKWAYDIASCEVQELGMMNCGVQLETYSESLVLSKEYGAHYLRDSHE
ncbi:putative F-box protein At1g32420 [Silene latifolia]|uniref:putative F-box protein At1g32420 n=1 Tax=Silene latifolia TaxID=37657 RepID=UPI003D789B7D